MLLVERSRRRLCQRSIQAAMSPQRCMGAFVGSQDHPGDVASAHRGWLTPSAVKSRHSRSGAGAAALSGRVRPLRRLDWRPGGPWTPAPSSSTPRRPGGADRRAPERSVGPPGDVAVPRRSLCCGPPRWVVEPALDSFGGLVYTGLVMPKSSMSRSQLSGVP